MWVVKCVVLGACFFPLPTLLPTPTLLRTYQHTNNHTCVSLHNPFPTLTLQTTQPRNPSSDGKVCLSLLGTWHGADEASKWSPTSSSLFQILLSIQGMIFVEVREGGGYWVNLGDVGEGRGEESRAGYSWR